MFKGLPSLGETSAFLPSYYDPGRWKRGDATFDIVDAADAVMGSCIRSAEVDIFVVAAIRVSDWRRIMVSDKGEDVDKPGDVATGLGRRALADDRITLSLTPYSSLGAYLSAGRACPLKEIECQ